MTQDPDKGELLSATRSTVARGGWRRDTFALKHPAAPTMPALVPSPVTVTAPPPKKRKPKLTPEQAEEARAQRIAQITQDATEAYNRILARPNGLLPQATPVGDMERRKNVTRCIKQASAICQHQFGDPKVTPHFWDRYFHEVDKDDFMAGRGQYSGRHNNWKPSFEYLTRPKTMIDVFEKAVSDE